MKIDADLRIAIGAAAKGQPQIQNKESWGDNCKRQKKAVEKLAKKTPELRVALNGIRLEQAKIKDAGVRIEKHEAVLKKFGIDDSSRPIDDADLFRSKGGDYPAAFQPWKAEACIARLAAAPDKKTFDAILKEYGIDWS